MSEKKRYNSTLGGTEAWMQQTVEYAKHHGLSLRRLVLAGISAGLDHMHEFKTYIPEAIRARGSMQKSIMLNETEHTNLSFLAVSLGCNRSVILRAAVLFACARPELLIVKSKKRRSDPVWKISWPVLEHILRSGVKESVDA